MPVRSGIGIVEAPADLNREAGRAMRVSQGVPGLKGVRENLIRNLEAGETRTWRGLVALALMAEILPGLHGLKLMTIRKGDGELADHVLTGMGETELQLCFLCLEDRSYLLGLVDREHILIPAAQRDDWDFPEDHVPWYSRENHAFLDPVPFLDGRERDVLAGKLRGGDFAPCAKDFARDLEACNDDMRRACGEERRRLWDAAMNCSICLEGIQGFEKVRLWTEPSVPLPPSPLSKALGIREPASFLPEKRILRWDQLTLAVSDPGVGMVPEKGGEAEERLKEVAGEASILETHSRPYAANALRRTQAFLAARGERMEDFARKALQDRVSQLMTVSMESPPAGLKLVFPWNEASPALGYLLRESLGEGLERVLIHPFADRLLLLDGAVMAALPAPEMEQVYLDNRTWQVLPPVSEGVFLYQTGQEEGCVHREDFHYSVGEAGRVLVTLSVRTPVGQAVFEKSYPPLEQVRLRGEEIPEVSLWPSVPVEAERWHAYYVSVRGRLEAVVRDGSMPRSVAGEENAGHSVIRTALYPSWILLKRNHLTLGALMIAEPVFRPESLGQAAAAMDIGESGTAMAFLENQEPTPFRMPSLWKVCLGGSSLDLNSEVLPVYPVDQVMESMVCLRAEKEKPEPFVDGWICPLDVADTQKPLCHFVCRRDERGRCARSVLIRQSMMMMSLHAVMHGRDGLTWYVSRPDSMEDAERAEMERLVREAAEDVEAWTGVRTVGLIFRRTIFCTQMYLYRALHRTSFMVMDMGASDTHIAVWLRGRSRPALEMHLGQGFVGYAMEAMIRNPSMASHDLSVMEGFPVETFTRCLRGAEASPEDREQVLHLMDLLFGPNLGLTAQVMNLAFTSGGITGLQAILLLYLSECLLLAGICLEKVGRSPLHRDGLPQELPLVLCGRGAGVYTVLDPTLRYQLMRFLRLPMSAEHPVRSLQLTMSQAPKMEAALGLLETVEEDTAADMRDCGSCVPLSATVGHFLMLFQAAVPQAGYMLFPGRFGPGGILEETTYAGIEELCSRTVSRSFASAFLQVVETLRVKQPVPEVVEVSTEMPAEEGDMTDSV